MTFDKRQEFEDYIKPQLVGLKRLCLKYDLPFFYAVCVENDEEKSLYENEMYSGLAKGIDLTADYFPNLAKVMRGFDTKLPSEPLLFDADDGFNNDFFSELESISTVNE